MNTFYNILIIGLFSMLGYTTQAQPRLQFKGEVSNQGVGLGVFFNLSEQVSGGFAPVNFPENVYGIGLGVESPLFYRNQSDGENKWVIAPRVSFEHHLTFLPLFAAWRINGLYYTDFDKGALTLRPEIGLTLRSNVYLFYGYNIPFQNQELIPLRNQITLGIMIPNIHF